MKLRPDFDFSSLKKIKSQNYKSPVLQVPDFYVKGRVEKQIATSYEYKKGTQAGDYFRQSHSKLTQFLQVIESIFN